MSSVKNSKLFHNRFKGLGWFEGIAKSNIFIGGAGGISSWLTLFLARTGANVIVLDFDTVEEENLAGQCYGKDDVGKPKVTAIYDVVSRLCGENRVTPLNAKIEESGGQWQTIIKRCDVVCVGFDNLQARELIYKEWKANGKKNSLFVDGRLAAEEGQVFVLDKTNSDDDYLAYEQTYFPESERMELPCSMKATTHCGAFIASMMTAQITNWFNNQNSENMPREVSNFEFHLQLMMLEQPRYKPIKKEEDVEVIAE